MERSKEIMNQLRMHDPDVTKQLQALLFNDDPAKVAKWHKLF